MESQHRKITYRMKHRGMYWSLKGAYTMSRLIILLMIYFLVIGEKSMNTIKINV